MENKTELKEAIENSIRANLLLHAVLENDEMDVYDVACKVNRKKYDGFNRAIEILSKLRDEGKCEFEAADIQVFYTIHTIYINWNLTDDFWVCIDDGNKSEIKELLDCTDECLIRDDEANIWQLSSRIYMPL